MRNGAWYTISPQKTVTCKRCGKTRLAWVKSKSGRFYLANTQRVQSENAQVDLVWVKPNQPHSCQEWTAFQERYANEMEREGLKARRVSLVEQVVALAQAAVDANPAVKMVEVPEIRDLVKQIESLDARIGRDEALS